MKPRICAKHVAIISRFRAGETQQSIADEYGLTRQRIQQVLVKYGLGKKDSARGAMIATRRVSERSATIARLDAYWRRVYGLSLIERTTIKRQFGHRPFRAYIEQRSMMCRLYGRAVWQISFTEWWGLWLASGKWQERGRGHGYGLMRNDALAPYSRGNCRIVSQPEGIRALHQAPAWREKWREAFDRAAA